MKETDKKIKPHRTVWQMQWAWCSQDPNGAGSSSLVQPARSGKVFQRRGMRLIWKGKSELANDKGVGLPSPVNDKSGHVSVTLATTAPHSCKKMRYIWLLKTRFSNIPDLCHKELNLSQGWTLVVPIWGEGKTVMLHISYGLLALTILGAKDLRSRAEGKLVLMNSWLNTDYWNDVLCNIWTWILFSITDWENSPGVNFNAMLLISHHVK